MSDAMNASYTARTRALSEGVRLSTKADRTTIACIDAAASKYRLAENLQKVDFRAYRTTTARAYESHLKILLAVIALEAYAKLFNRKLHQAHIFVPSGALRDLSAIVRDSFDEAALTKVCRAVDNRNLKSRIEAFIRLETSDGLAICEALRHGLAHGTLSAQVAVARSGDLIRQSILSAIQTDGEERTRKWLF
jgi:hypothetical protein